MKFMVFLIFAAIGLSFLVPESAPAMDFSDGGGLLLIGAVSINFYEKFIEFVGDGGIDLDTDVFDIILMTDSHTFTPANLNKAAIVANEIPAGNGYLQGTETLVSIAWSETGGVTTWDAVDVQWSASGGSIPDTGLCEHAVIYDEDATTPSADLLVCSIGFGQSESAGNGTNFNINWDGSGIFTIT